MTKKDILILIETVLIIILLINSIIYTVMSQDLVNQVRECDTYERKINEAIYDC